MRGKPTRFPARIRALALAQAEHPIPRLDLSSLVDVAFLLLTFFVLTSTLDPKEADLGFSLIPRPVSMPKEGGDKFIPEITQVEIDKTGAVWCAGMMVSEADSAGRKLPALLNKLKEIRSANAMFDRSAAIVVEVKAADEAKGQRFIDVMNCLAEAGIEDVRLEGFVD